MANKPNLKAVNKRSLETKPIEPEEGTPLVESDLSEGEKIEKITEEGDGHFKRSTLMTFFSLLNQFEALDPKNVPRKFAYWIGKNKMMMEKELELIEKTFKPSEKFTEFEQKRVEMAKRFSEKDEDGNPVIVGNVFKIASDLHRPFKVELELLRGEYIEAVNEHELRMKERDDFLDEMTDFKPFQVKFDHFPETGISGEQMRFLMKLGTIMEDEE